MTRKTSGKSTAAVPAVVEEKCPLIGGEVVTFLYPARPYFGISGPLEPQFGRVTDIRDLHADPLIDLELDENPTLLRSRFLITIVTPDTEVRLGSHRACFSGYIRHLQILPPGLMVSRPANLWAERSADSGSEPQSSEKKPRRVKAK